MDTKVTCLDSLEENGDLHDLPTQADLPTLTGNQCEAVKRRELGVPLLEIPQEEEDPMSLSVGTKGNGATLHFKIPLSSNSAGPGPFGEPKIQGYLKFKDTSS
jgi:hypothetical protein